MNEREAELVITAPSQLGAKLAYEVGARMTLGVLTELLASSRTALLIAAPFLQRGGPLSSEPLASALQAALERGVLVDIVSTGTGIRNLDSDLFRGTRAPVRFFQPAANITDTRLLGSHAKICVADGEHAYIGSANLTGPSIMSNLEGKYSPFPV